MVQGHDDHDQASQEVDGLDPVRECYLCVNKQGFFRGHSFGAYISLRYTIKAAIYQLAGILLFCILPA